MTRLKSVVHRHRIALAAVVALASVALIVLGAFRLWTWSKPMAQGNYSQAISSTASLQDKAVALYDRGLGTYQKAENDTNASDQGEDLNSAQNDLTAAYNDLLNAGGGQIAPADAKLASTIEFRLGNIQVIQGLNQQSATLIDNGVQDYEQCLRLDPGGQFAMYAKYNIELLEQSSKVNGKGNPATPGQKKGQKPGKPGSKPGGSQAGHSHDNGT